MSREILETLRRALGAEAGNRARPHGILNAARVLPE